MWARNFKLAFQYSCCSGATVLLNIAPLIDQQQSLPLLPHCPTNHKEVAICKIRAATFPVTTIQAQQAVEDKAADRSYNGGLVFELNTKGLEIGQCRRRLSLSSCNATFEGWKEEMKVQQWITTRPNESFIYSACQWNPTSRQLLLCTVLCQAGMQDCKHIVQDHADNTIEVIVLKLFLYVIGEHWICSTADFTFV